MKILRAWLGRSVAGAMVAAGLGLAGCAEKPGPTMGGVDGATNGSRPGASGDGRGTNGASALPQTNVPSALRRAVPVWPPTQAQPKLRTLKLYVGREVITAELALSQVEVGTGMMFRTSMAEDEGMLFVFPNPHRTAFYMRNTTVPLTAAYIDPQGTILELVELQPLVETPVEAKTDNIQYVLEMNRGWFERHKIGVGTVISTERGSLAKTFGLGE